MDFGEIIAVVGGIEASQPVVQLVIKRFEQAVDDTTVGAVRLKQGGEGCKADDQRNDENAQKTVAQPFVFLGIAETVLFGLATKP